MSEQAVLCSIFDRLCSPAQFANCEIRNIAKAQYNAHSTAAKKVAHIMAQWNSRYQLYYIAEEHVVSRKNAQDFGSETDAASIQPVDSSETSTLEVLRQLVVLQNQHMADFQITMKEMITVFQRNYDQLALATEPRGKRPRLSFSR
jgi:hypothetical protein